MGGQGYDAPPMSVQGFSVCFDTEYALEYWSQLIVDNPHATDRDIVTALPWMGVALFTPEIVAGHLGLSVQDAIDFAHNLVKTETSDLGWDTDKTGNSSPAILWNQGQGFTHPTLDTTARTELLIYLKYDRDCIPADYSEYSVPCYGSPSLPPETPAQKELALFEALAI